MKRFRNGLIIVATLIIIMQVFRIDYSNLSWQVNELKYISIFAMIIQILLMVFLNRKEKKEEL